MSTLEFDDYLTETIKQKGHPTTWEQACTYIFESIVRLGSDRHHRYGPDNIEKGEEFGVVQQIENKLHRIKNMLRALSALKVIEEHGFKDSDVARSLRKEIVDVRSLYDNWCDLANYSMYAIMLSAQNEDGQAYWRLPMHSGTETEKALEIVGVKTHERTYSS